MEFTVYPQSLDILPLDSFTLCVHACICAATVVLRKAYSRGCADSIFYVSASTGIFAK